MNKHLRNIKSILIVIIAAGLLSACSKKNEEKPADQITGNWNISSVSFDATINGKPMIQYFQDLGASQDQIDSIQQAFNSALQGEFSGTINIKSDNTYTTSIGGTTSTGTWSINSAGDKLTITPSDGDPVVYDIIKLDNSNLDVKFSMSQSTDVNGDETPETMVIIIDMKLSK